MGSPANVNTAITAASIANYDYGINDVYTDAEGKVYFWLPETSGYELITATVNGSTYGNCYARSANSDDAQTLNAAYVVTFDIGGGSSIASQEKYNGQTVEEPDDPARSGYSFVGWYSDSAYTKKYDFSAAVTSSFTLYVKRQANSGGDSGRTYSHPQRHARPHCR